MKNRLFCSTFFVAILFALSGFSQEFKQVADSKSVFQLLKVSAEKSKTIRADFLEEKHVSYLKNIDKSNGIFLYQQKDQLRWEILKPNPYIVLIDGDKLRISENGKEKNIKAGARIADRIKNMMLTMVNGDFQNNKDFSKEVFQNSKEYQVVLKPVNKQLKQRFDRITMNFSKSSMGLNKITFFEVGGDKQIINFSNIAVNQPIEASSFSKF